MDRIAKLYRLHAELMVLKSAIQEFTTLHPNPTRWTQNEVTHYDLLAKRRDDIRAEIAELESYHPNREHLT
jgi:hypothetical protein